MNEVCIDYLHKKLASLGNCEWSDVIRIYLRLFKKNDEAGSSVRGSGLLDRPIVKPFSCHRCDRKFNSKYNVIRHLRQYHAERRMFKCSVCGRDYKWVDSLHKHMKMHKQEN